MFVHQGVTAEVKALSAGKGDSHRHPYNLGMCHNLHQIFGDTSHEWCLPPTRPTPGGTAYPSVFDPDVTVTKKFML